jgi:hypothetical protein
VIPHPAGKKKKGGKKVERIKEVLYLIFLSALRVTYGSINYK